MRNIILYIPSFESGGAERVASVLINFWTEERLYSTTVINTLPKETDFYNLDNSVSRVFLNYNYNRKNKLSSIVEKIRRLYILRKKIKSREEDLIVTFMSSPSLLMLIATIGLDKKIICCEHTNYYRFGNKFTRQLKSLVYYFCAYKLTVLTKRDMKNYPSYLRKKITVLPNPLGVDGYFYQNPYFTQNIIKKKVQLLFVGRLTRVKGIERLCTVLNGIESDDWHLTICGDGELKDYLNSQLKVNNLVDKVSVIGAVKNIADYYIQSDLLLMTSLAEGLPMVIAEAMSFGVPVIAFDCPTGPREFITQAVNGILVSDGEIDEYIKELERLILNPILIQKLSESCKNSIKSYQVLNIHKIWEEVFLDT